MSYENVYVAHVAYSAKDTQTLHAFLEAEAYEGPSLIIAYSPCIAHGIDMTKGLDQQKLAVQSGIWPLLRYDPRLIEDGKNPLIIDSKKPTIQPQEYMYNETRYRMLVQTNEARAEMLLKAVKKYSKKHLEYYKQMAAMHYGENGE